jgi:hypothetical protein
MTRRLPHVSCTFTADVIASALDVVATHRP